MSYTKGAIILSIVTAGAAIIKLIVQARIAKEAAAAKLIADAEVAKLRREAEERAARHAREAEVRAEEAEERKDERAQKEKVFAELQAANKRTLDFMEAQLKSQQEIGALRYQIVERNTASVEKLALELRVMVDRVGRLESGAGCKAGTSVIVQERRAA